MEEHQAHEPEKQSNRGKILFFIFTIAIVGLIFGAGFVNDKIHKQEFCFSCHEMNPNGMTHELVAHSKIDCINCHKDISLISFAYRHTMYKYRLGEIKTIKKNIDMPDSICRQCHSVENREITPPGDLLVGHKFHIKRKIDCIDCHRNVAHADVVELLKENGLKAEDFTKETAAKLLENGNRVPESRCMRCHNGEKAPDSCETCHSTPNKTRVKQKVK